MNEASERTSTHDSLRKPTETDRSELIFHVITDFIWMHFAFVGARRRRAPMTYYLLVKPGLILVQAALGLDRQDDTKARATAKRALYFDPPTMGFDKGFDDKQA